MFCSKCGKTLMPEDLQCFYCGYPVGESRFEGTPYTSAQQHIKPGMKISFAAPVKDAEAPEAQDAETAAAAVEAAPEQESAFAQQEAPAYTRITYTTMTDAQKEEGDVDTRTTYRPVYGGSSVPEEMRRDMRAIFTDPEEEEEEAPAPMPEELSEEAINTLNAVDEELKMEEMDMSQFRARSIQSSGRAGISTGVSDYIQQLETNQARRDARRKKRVYAEDMDEAYATPQEELPYEAEEDMPVNPDIDTEQSEVFDDINEEEFEELRYGRVLGVKDILKYSLIIIVAAAIFVGGFLWFRNFKGSQSSAPIEGVSETLYEDGIAALKAHVEQSYINQMLGVYNADGILKLTTELQADTTELDNLIPGEPAINDALFISALQAIQSNIGNAIMMDATAGANTEDSAARWDIVNNSIVQLESATTAAALTAILNGEQIDVVTGTEATPTPAPTYKPLTKGEKSDDVLDLQNRLYELGFLLEDRDGDYGSKTQTAVKLFQSEANLPVTGIADSETLAAIYADDAPRTEYAQVTPTPKPTATPKPEA